MMDIITLEGVSKTFKNNLVFKDINLKIKEGNIVGILGRSGSGKSVLLKILMKYLTPTSGNLRVNGKIGFSSQSNSLYENLTLEQNLNYFSDVYSIKDKKKVVDYLINLLYLSPYRGIKVRNLSGGTKKRADIACAMLDSPKILILDEPFVGLDSFLVNEISNFLRTLRQKGVTIILSSHLIEQVDGLCNRFFFIENSSLKEIDRLQLKSLYNQK